jgi:unsaturated rhamnogalacturonyl hydrolase
MNRRAPHAAGVGDAPAVALPALVARMAAATIRYPFKRWGFGESIAIEALLAAGGAPGRWAADLVGEWAADHPPLAEDPLAHVAPGVPLLLVAERADADRASLLACAHELATVLATGVVGRHGARIHRPDLCGWEHEVWVDCMHLDGPFLARLFAVTGEDRFADLAADLLLSHARVLQDERSGLFSHGFDDATGERNNVHWGRGQGWALLGLVDTLKNLPAEHPARAEATDRLEVLVEALAATETDPGAWHTVVDAPDTFVESSVGAFVALGVGRGIRYGLLAASWSALADRAWTATRGRISPDGFLEGVSDATPVGADAAHYGARARGSFPWGQGPALLAAVERLRSPSGGPEVRHG